MCKRTLTLSDDEYGLVVSVWFDRWDLDRAQWSYSVRCLDEVLCAGTDLRSGSGEAPCEADAMATLLSFLAAYAEAIASERTGRPSDNADLFPESMRDAADAIGAEGFFRLQESVRAPEEIS